MQLWHHERPVTEAQEYRKTHDMTYMKLSQEESDSDSDPDSDDESTCGIGIDPSQR